LASKEEFAKFMLTMGAAIPRFAPNTGDPNVLSVWFAELGSLSVDELRFIYSRAVKKFDSFPSMREVLELVDRDEQSPEEISREVAELIWSGISRFSTINGRDSAKWDAICEYLGPVGAEVVRAAGGWNNICDNATNANMTSLKAQWREFAKVVATRGPNRKAPDFDSLPTRPELLQLGRKFS